MSALIAIGWNPELRGILTVIIGTVVLCGSVYLLLGTNVGARLGFLVALAGLFGWMACMGMIWWAYGIGLKGPEPSWKPAQPFTIIRDPQKLTSAGVLDASLTVSPDSSMPDRAAQAADAIEGSGWEKLPEDDPGRGQAIAAADEIVLNEAGLYELGQYQAVAVYDKGGDRYPKINDSLDFLAFLHEPHYALVEIVPLVPQRDEPGRAPSRPVIDDEQPHQYVMMERDRGGKRHPAAAITIFSSLIFGLCCYLLHRRDKIVAVNRGLVPAKA